MTKKSTDKINQSLNRFTDILSETERQEILDIQQKPLPMGIRINPLKGEPQTIIRDLVNRYGWMVSPEDFCEYGWMIKYAQTPPGGTIEHRMGLYYLQDPASMVPVSLFDFQEDELLILDMAASPGGKTTHLVDRTHDRGFILANDASKSRIPALRSVLAAWGAINQAVVQYPGESFGSWYPETFDRILLDAPCSMENLRPTTTHPLRDTSVDERLRLQERQVQLLTGALGALKTGGQIVYATCSLAPEEDEAVLDALVRRYPNSVQIDDMADKVPFDVPGLISFNQQVYHPDVAHALRLWPHRTGMSGFFCARLTKRNPISIVQEPPPARAFSKTGLELTGKDLQYQIFNQIRENYGFDLEPVQESTGFEVFSRHEQLFLIPRHYLAHFSNLPFEYIGLPLGRWNGEKIEPAHPFINRFGHRFTRGIIQIENKQVDQWISGRDLRYPQTSLTPQGQYLLVTDQDGRNLGLGKLLPKRLRNMLPR